MFLLATYTLLSSSLHFDDFLPNIRACRLLEMYECGMHFHISFAVYVGRYHMPALATSTQRSV